MPVDPALPAHCLRPYDMGHEFSRVVMPELEDDDDWYGYDDYDFGYGFDPSYWAYHDRHCTLEDDEREARLDKLEQEEWCWQEHEAAGYRWERRHGDPRCACGEPIHPTYGAQQCWQCGAWIPAQLKESE